LATTPVGRTEEMKLRQEVSDKLKEYNRIKEENNLFGKDLDVEEANAKAAYEAAEKDLKEYRKTREETLTPKKKENRINTLNTRLGAEKVRIDGLKDPNRPEGFLVPSPTNDKIAKLEQKFYEKTQEIKRLGGTPAHTISYDVFKPTDKPDQAEENKGKTTEFNQPLAPSVITGRSDLVTKPTTTIVGVDVSADLSDPLNRQVLPTSETGVYTLTKDTAGLEYLFLGDSNTDETFSRPVSYEEFVYNIRSMSPIDVINYKRAMGYKDQSSVITDQFRSDLTKAAKAVSAFNYENAAIGKNVQASLENYLATPEKYNIGSVISGAGAETAGPSADEIKVKRDSVNILATELGVQLSSDQLNRLARDWAIGSYDTNTIKSAIAQTGTIDFSKGVAAETLSNLKELAGAYGIQFDEAYFNKAATNVLTQQDTLETYTQQIKNDAKSRFPTLAAQIDAGFTVRQLASPYVQSMSSILEIDPNTISLNDYYVNRALTGLDAENKPTTQPLWQFEKELRKDPRWNYTQNAQDSLMNTARRVLQDFGLVS